MPRPTIPSDALVFFGATGDLAYKKIFPAIQTLIQHGHLDVPIVGVAKSGWGLKDLIARARSSLETHGGIDEAAFTKMVKRLRYVDGDYNDSSTFEQLKQALGDCQATASLPGDPAQSLRNGRGASCPVGLCRGRAGRDRETVRP